MDQRLETLERRIQACPDDVQALREWGALVDRLGWQHHGRSPSEWLEQLGARDWETRFQAAKRLESLGGRALTPLIAGLQHSEATARYNCADLLGRLGELGHCAIPALQSALGDSSEMVRRRASEALTHLGHRSAVLLQTLFDNCNSNDHYTASESSELLVQFQGEAIPLLIETLDYGQGRQRVVAAKLLTRLGAHAEKAVPALIRALKNGDSELQRQSLCALRVLKNKAADAKETLRAMWDSDDDELRGYLAVALGSIAGTTMLDEFCKELRGRDPLRRIASLRALELLEEKAVAAIPDILKMRLSNDREISLGAYRALGRIKTPHSIEMLIEDILDDRQRLNAMTALAQATAGTAQGLETLVLILETGRTMEKRHAIRLLGDLGHHAKPALEPLREFVQSETGPLQFEAVSAISAIETDVRKAR